MEVTLAKRPAAPAASVRLEVIYLARLRETLGMPGETVHLHVQDADVGALLAHLRARGGAFAAELAAGRAFRVAVNHAMGTDATTLRDGDEVALFPPVTGG